MARSSASSPTNPIKTETASAAAPDIETVKADAGAALDEAKNLVGQVADEASAAAGQVAEQAKAQISEQTERFKGMAGEQKDLFAEQIGGVASAMDKIASELESTNSTSARYARLIADNADKVSSTIRDNDVDALFNMAQDFGRRQPAAFLGAAALLGFAASRFLMASASRPVETSSTGAESELGEDGPSYAGTSTSDAGDPYQSGRV